MIKKILILLISTIFILFLSGCNKTPQEKQKEYLKNSDAYLFNQNFEKLEPSSTRKFLGQTLKYTNYIKSLNNEYDITNVGIFSFKDNKTLKEFKKTWEKELEATISVNSSNNKNNLRFEKKTKKSEDITIYTSIFQKEQETRTILLKADKDTNCFTIITGEGKKTKEKPAIIVNKLIKSSLTLLDNFSKSHNKKKDYLPKKERKLLTKTISTLEKNNFQVQFNPNKTNKNYYLEITSNKSNAKTNEIYSTEIIINKNTKETLEKFNQREANINQELKTNKELKPTKIAFKNKNYLGFTYKIQTTNGSILTKTYRSKNNHIYINIDYRINKQKDLTKNDNYIKKLLNNLITL